MATELLSPLIPHQQRRRALAVVVAAPLHALLLAAVAFSRSPVAAPASSSRLVDLTLLAGARGKGAVCLDGTPPGYHLRRGFGSGAHNWLVFLEGGGWCNTTQSCSERKMTNFGSSKYMGAVNFTGILSNDHTENPDFYNWNTVVIRYCDGASFAGDAEGGDLDGTKLFFRGLRIWKAVVDELMGKGMDAAKQALLTGCSAGSLAALLHCDNFHGRFPHEVSVKCLSDAGFFIDEKDLSGERSMRSLISGVVHLQCFFPAELIKGITTPTFILNSDYDSWQEWSSCKADIRNCSCAQLDVLHGFKKKLVSELKVAEDNKDWGLFIDSCFTHCQTPFDITWNSPISPRLGNKSISEAVGDWYFDRRQNAKQIDCEYPCNPTCSSLLPTA
ncbi:Pectin acetylesterase 5 [Zea mays]|uniref:Pectin acetylesterase n=2 Tax=Zea mays TaxID=4577 RepID=A0A1D6G799_MAIZE|nr:Pectin acetylesterase 5 [Zea mays]